MSRYPRCFQKSDRESRCYHVICRVTQQEFWLKSSRVKKVLRKQLWASAEFSGVEVMAYCWMSSHIHLLIRVPANENLFSDDVLLQRVKALYGTGSKRGLYAETVFERGGADADSLRLQLTTRMHDLSEFMRTWKQRFAIWHNKTFNKIGTLWSERFKSLWVQDAPHVLRSVAAYIHLNPVRAGMVDRAKDHRGSLWSDCFNGESELRRISRNAICRLMKTDTWRKASHLMVRYFKGESNEISADYRRRLRKTSSENASTSPQNPMLDNAPSPLSHGNYIGTESFVLERLLDRGI